MRSRGEWLLLQLHKLVYQSFCVTIHPMYDEDWDDDDTVETIPCPNCGVDVYEEAEQCPACGEYIIRDTSVLSGKPTWYVVGAILGIIAVIIVLLQFI